MFYAYIHDYLQADSKSIKKQIKSLFLTLILVRAASVGFLVLAYSLKIRHKSQHHESIIEARYGKAQPLLITRASESWHRRHHQFQTNHMLVDKIILLITEKWIFS